MPRENTFSFFVVFGVFLFVCSGFFAWGGGGGLQQELSLINLKITMWLWCHDPLLYQSLTLIKNKTLSKLNMQNTN